MASTVARAPCSCVLAASTRVGCMPQPFSRSGRNACAAGLCACWRGHLSGTAPTPPRHTRALRIRHNGDSRSAARRAVRQRPTAPSRSRNALNLQNGPKRPCKEPEKSRSVSTWILKVSRTSFQLHSPDPENAPHSSLVSGRALAERDCRFDRRAAPMTVACRQSSCATETAPRPGCWLSCSAPTIPAEENPEV